MSGPSSEAGDRPQRGLIARHPRLGILLIGALFLSPVCAMMLIVTVLILT